MANLPPFGDGQIPPLDQQGSPLFTGTAPDFSQQSQANAQPQTPGLPLFQFSLPQRSAALAPGPVMPPSGPPVFGGFAMPTAFAPPASAAAPQYAADEVQQFQEPPLQHQPQMSLDEFFMGKKEFSFDDFTAAGFQMPDLGQLMPNSLPSIASASLGSSITPDILRAVSCAATNLESLEMGSSSYMEEGEAFFADLTDFALPALSTLHWHLTSQDEVLSKDVIKDIVRVCPHIEQFGVVSLRALCEFLGEENEVQSAHSLKTLIVPDGSLVLEWTKMIDMPNFIKFAPQIEVIYFKDHSTTTPESIGRLQEKYPRLSFNYLSA